MYLSNPNDSASLARNSKGSDSPYCQERTQRGPNYTHIWLDVYNGFTSCFSKCEYVNKDTKYAQINFILITRL